MAFVAEPSTIGLQQQQQQQPPIDKNRSTGVNRPALGLLFPRLSEAPDPITVEFQYYWALRTALDGAITMAGNNVLKYV